MGDSSNNHISLDYGKFADTR